MKTSAILFSFIINACAAYAWQPIGIDVTQTQLTENSEPDHLLPVDQAVPETYYLAQFIAGSSSSDFSKLIVRRKEEKYFMEVHVKGGSDPTNTVEITESDARLIYSIWINTLLETRYARKSSAGLDGGTFIFSSYVRGLGWVHGKTWSPSSDAPPRWLIETADSLFQFTLDKRRKIEDLHAQLVATNSKILSYLTKNGKL